MPTTRRFRHAPRGAYFMRCLSLKFPVSYRTAAEATQIDCQLIGQFPVNLLFSRGRIRLAGLVLQAWKWVLPRSGVLAGLRQAGARGNPCKWLSTSQLASSPDRSDDPTRRSGSPTARFGGSTARFGSPTGRFEGSTTQSRVPPAGLTVRPGSLTILPADLTLRPDDPEIRPHDLYSARSIWRYDSSIRDFDRTIQRFDRSIRRYDFSVRQHFSRKSYRG